MEIAQMRMGTLIISLLYSNIVLIFPSKSVFDFIDLYLIWYFAHYVVI